MPPNQPQHNQTNLPTQPQPGTQFPGPSGSPQPAAPLPPVAPARAGSKLPLILFAALFVLIIAGAVAVALNHRNDQTANTPDHHSAQNSAQNSDNSAMAQLTQAQMRGRDTDRKNALKNLQQRLESYYNDNAVYPATLQDLGYTLSKDQVTDPLGRPYSYLAGADLQTYTLAAELENKDDRDAEQDGRYVLHSVNY